MPPESRDPSYLWDMLDAARSVRQFTQGVTLEHYLKDPMMQRAVERALEIIGEAARRLSEGFRRTHREIAWQSIIGLRNILVHEYGEVRPERLWSIATEHIPELIQQIEPLLPPEEA